MTTQHLPKIGIAGCTGALGRLVVRRIMAHEGCSIAGGAASPISPALGRDVADEAGVGPCGLSIGGDPQALFSTADVVIDFSVPVASARNAEVAADTGVGLVLATTGLDNNQRQTVERSAARAPILHTPNLSPGITVMLSMVKMAAAALGENYDAEILGFSHRRKRDAPSGTSLALGRAIAAARDMDPETSDIRQRDGNIGPRPRGMIGYANLRGGEVSGVHTAIFAGDWEQLEVTHRVLSRDLYAAVAVEAALWLCGKPPGLYALSEVLGLD